MGSEMLLVPIFAILGTFTAAILIVFFVSRSRQRRAEVQAEMQTKLIDRFTSAPELVEFLQSPAGQKFVTGVQSAPAILARERIMGGFTRSIVLSFLGLAFLFLTFYEDRDFVVPAAILLSLGVGYLVATFVSFKMLAGLRGEAQPGELAQ